MRGWSTAYAGSSDRRDLEGICRGRVRVTVQTWSAHRCRGRRGRRYGGGRRAAGVRRPAGPDQDPRRGDPIGRRFRCAGSGGRDRPVPGHRRCRLPRRDRRRPRVRPARRSRRVRPGRHLESRLPGVRDPPSRRPVTLVDVGVGPADSPAAPWAPCPVTFRRCWRRPASTRGTWTPSCSPTSTRTTSAGRSIRTARHAFPAPTTSCSAPRCRHSWTRVTRCCSATWSSPCAEPVNYGRSTARYACPPPGGDPSRRHDHRVPTPATPSPPVGGRRRRRTATCHHRDVLMAPSTHVSYLFESTPPRPHHPRRSAQRAHPAPTLPPPTFTPFLPLSHKLDGLAYVESAR